MAKSSFGKIFLIALGVGGAAGIVAGLGDRAEAATKAPPPPPPKPPVKKKRRKVASAEVEQEGEEAMVGASPFARPLAYLYGVWPLIKSGISSRDTMEQALQVASTLLANEAFTTGARKEETNFVATLHIELTRRVAREPSTSVGDYRDDAAAKVKLIEGLIAHNNLSGILSADVGWDLFTHAIPRFYLNVHPGASYTIRLPSGKSVELTENQRMDLGKKIAGAAGSAYGIPVWTRVADKGQDTSY